MHPYVKAAHRNDPKWVKGLDMHKEAKASDLTATIRNNGGDARITAQAAYEPQKKDK